MSESATAQQHHPSALRNRIPILKAMMQLLPDSDTYEGFALEIATGTGALMEVLAPAYPSLTFQPSEYVPETPAPPEEQWSQHGKIGLRGGVDELSNIDEHASKVFKNCLTAIALDLMQPWPSAVTDRVGKVELIVCSNTLHITPWACTVNLLSSAGAVLAPGGNLVLYGPFKVGGEFIGTDGGEGNRNFDVKLRSTNEVWGIRNVDDLCELASSSGLTLRAKKDMPSNNLLLHFMKGEK